MPYAASSKCSITWKIQTSKVKAWDFGWIRKQPPQTKSTAFYWNNTKLRPTPRSFQFFLSMERVSCSSCRVRAMIFGHHKKCIPAPSEVEAMLPEKDRNEFSIQNWSCFKMFQRTLLEFCPQRCSKNFCFWSQPIRSLSMMLGKCSSRMRYMCSIGMKSSSISLCLA